MVDPSKRKLTLGAVLVSVGVLSALWGYFCFRYFDGDPLGVFTGCFGSYGIGYGLAKLTVPKIYG